MGNFPKKSLFIKVWGRVWKFKSRFQISRGLIKGRGNSVARGHNKAGGLVKIIGPHDTTLIIN